MTAKQKTKIDKLIECSGRGPVQAYIWYFYPGVEVENLSTVQAQKLITGFFEGCIRKNEVKKYGSN